MDSIILHCMLFKDLSIVLFFLFVFVSLIACLLSFVICGHQVVDWAH